MNLQVNLRVAKIPWIGWIAVHYWFVIQEEQESQRQWEGEEAKRLAEIIRKTPSEYPYNYCYRYYPGPNSNTYVQWILNQASIDYRLNRRGLGKYYPQYQIWGTKLQI